MKGFSCGKRDGSFFQSTVFSTTKVNIISKTCNIARYFNTELFISGPNEEKVSGSILLPSYTISPLSKDDGVYRKYAFKAEHANMRTYYFAAETKDSMIQWMNSLSLASILQNETK